MRPLNFAVVAVICLVAMSGVAVTMAAEPGQGVLFWGNGDRLSGRLVSAQGDTLIWEAPSLFADPLEVELSVLSAVQLDDDQPSTDDDAAEFRITMTNSNVLHGRIVAADAESLTVESRRHGRIRILQRHILNLQERKKQGLLFLGPRGLEGWKAHGTDHELADWREENDGSLTAENGDTALYCPLELPEQCDIEVVLSSARAPDFILSLGSRENENPRVEVWGDELVARCGLEFVELRSLSPDEHRIHLHLLADFGKKVMSVYSRTGQLLGQISSGPWKQPTHGVVFEAVENDLTINYLRVSEWDGRLPTSLRPGESRVHTRAGDIHYGAIQGYSPETQTLTILLTPGDAKNSSDGPADAPTVGGKRLEVPLAEVTRVVIANEEQRTNKRGHTLVSWKDGGFVSGTMVSMSAESVSLKTDYTDEPVVSTLQGIRRIRLPNTAETPEEPDRLFFDGGSLHGNLTMEDHDSIPIRWTPVGGKNATPLLSRGKARFQRGREPEELAIDVQQFPDVVFLKNGDVVPCRLEQCDLNLLRLVSPVADVRQLKTVHVKAIELGSITRARHIGFGDDGWKNRTGSVIRTQQALQFKSTGSYGHTEILTGNTVSFRMQWTPQTYGSLTTWLYAEKLHSPEHGTPVTLTLSPGQVVVSQRPPDQNQGVVVFGGPGPQGSGQHVVKVGTQEADVQLLVRDGTVRVSVNGEDAATFELNSSGPAGRGLLFDAAITQVNRRMIINGQGQDNQNDIAPLEITELSIRNVSGTSVAQFISSEARERALTIPRFRRDDPPTHVLLAPNGDLLRGRLVDIGDTHVRFESRLETFRFPRERVAAVVWLQSSSDAPAARPATAVQSQLDNGYTLTMTPERMRDGLLMGHSELLGDCRIPAPSIRDLFLGDPDGREEILSYVRWIPVKAREPDWELPEAGQNAEDASPLIGQTAEDFELQLLDGTLFRLSDYQDRVVVLDFWASWCGPCIAALPGYVAAVSEFDESQAIFVAVNLEESPDRIREFLERQNLSMTVALDRGSVVARRFGVSGIPHSVVLGPGNVIRHVTVGYRDDIRERTRQHIADLLQPAPADDVGDLPEE